MNWERLPNKAIATVATVLALGGLAACGKSDEYMLTDPWTPPREATCNGLPPYEITGRSKDGDPLLQFKQDEDCVTYLYDEESLQEIPHSLVNKNSTFFACYEGEKPERIEATLTFYDHVGSTGMINLGHDAAEQLANQHDIPDC